MEMQTNNSPSTLPTLSLPPITPAPHFSFEEKYYIEQPAKSKCPKCKVQRVCRTIATGKSGKYAGHCWIAYNYCKQCGKKQPSTPHQDKMMSFVKDIKPLTPKDIEYLQFWKDVININGKSVRRVTLKVYPLPEEITLEADHNDCCPKCNTFLTLRYTCIKPIITAAGFYVGQYWLNGYFYCNNCDFVEGSKEVPLNVMAMVAETREAISQVVS